jgi:hypothetical protein
MTIDPLEVIIKWLTNTLTRVSGRVAGKHRYGSGWTEAQTGVSVRFDGGTFDNDSPIAVPRLEVLIHSNDMAAIVDVYRDLVKLGRDNVRFKVDTSKGTALVHYFKVQTPLSTLYDEDLRMDYGMVFFEAMVSEEAVSGYG